MTNTIKLYDDKFESMVRGKKLADISKDAIHSIQEERIEQYLKWGGLEHDDGHARKLVDAEEYALYRKVCDEAWQPLPETYRKHGRDHWRYKNDSRSVAD